MGGPFIDRSGGLIAFEIESSDKAEQLVADDPFPPGGAHREQVAEGVGHRLSAWWFLPSCS
jgi:hypothetical protein